MRDVPYINQGMRAMVSILLEMESDNGVRFAPTPAQMSTGAHALALMLIAKAPIDDAGVEMLAAGEESEMRAMFSRYNGFDDLTKVLGEILNGHVIVRRVGQRA